MKPIIGVTTSINYENGRYEIGKDYIEGVIQAGGIPVAIPSVIEKLYLRAIIERLDGLLLSGGVDVDPKYFGDEPINNLGNISPERDMCEIELTKSALAKDLPILGICRGIQVLNIAAGGTVYQDINSVPSNKRIKHSQSAPRWYPTHKVIIKENSKLSKILNTKEHRVNSFHHQAVSQLAEGFTASAYGPDGIIEAIESKNHIFAVGVQWHPENMWQKDKVMLNLFNKFVEVTYSNNIG